MFRMQSLKSGLKQKLAILSEVYFGIIQTLIIQEILEVPELVVLL